MPAPSAFSVQFHSYKKPGRSETEYISNAPGIPKDTPYGVFFTQ